MSGGDYGWVLLKDKTASQIIQNIKDGVTSVQQPLYLYSAKSRNVDDIGGTYVEVCISKQEMWCYKNYVCIVDTPVVTGNVTYWATEPIPAALPLTPKKSLPS